MSMSSRSAAVLPVLLLAIIALSRIVSIWDGRDPGYDQAMLMSNFPLPPFATYFGPLPYFEQAAPLGSVLELDLVSRIFGNEGLTRFTVIRLIAAALAVGGYFILWRIMRRYFETPEVLWAIALLACTNEVLLFTTNPKQYVFGFFFACALLWAGLSFLDRPTLKRAAVFTGCAILACLFAFTAPLILATVGGGLLAELISRHRSSAMSGPDFQQGLYRLLGLGAVTLTISLGFHVWYTLPMAELDQVAYADRYLDSFISVTAAFSAQTIESVRGILNVYFLMIEPVYFPQTLHVSGLIWLLPTIHVLCAVIALVGLPTYWRKAPVLAGGLVIGTLAFLVFNAFQKLPITSVRHFLFFTPFAVPCFAVGSIVILRWFLNLLRLSRVATPMICVLSFGLVSVALARSADLKNNEISAHLEMVERHPAKMWVYYGAQPSLRALRPDLMSGENFEVIGLLNHNSTTQSWQMQARDDDNFLTSDDYVERAAEWLSGTDPIWLVFAHYWPEKLVPGGVSRFVELARADGRVCKTSTDKGGILVFCAEADAIPPAIDAAFK